MFEGLNSVISKLRNSEMDSDNMNNRIRNKMKKFMPYMNTNIYTDAHELDDDWKNGETITYLNHRKEKITTEVWEYVNMYYYPSSGVFHISTGTKHIVFGHFQNESDSIPDPEKVEKMFQRKIQAQIDNLESHVKYSGIALEVMQEVSI